MIEHRVRREPSSPGRTRSRAGALRRTLCGLGAALLLPSPAAADEGLRLDFREEVQNLPILKLHLLRASATRVRECDGIGGSIRHGSLPFRRAGEGAASQRSFIPFVALYREGRAPALLVDHDRDGVVSCAESLGTLPHPRRNGRAFRTVPLAWGADGAPARSQRVRLVLPERLEQDALGDFELELIDVPTARLEVGGHATTWLLMDGNRTGLFGDGFDDAVLVHWEGGGALSLDAYGGHRFSPQAVIRLPWGDYRVVEADPLGRFLTLGAAPAEAARLWTVHAAGETPPPGTCLTRDGDPVTIGGARAGHQIAYYWISTCGACGEDMRALAPLVERFHGRGISFVGVSLDGDRADFEAFLQEHRPGWPQCDSNGRLWDTSLAFRYGVRGGGDFVVLGPSGVVTAKGHGHRELGETALGLIGDETSRR